MIKTGFNVTDSPIIVADNGRQIGGREWGPVDTTADVVKEQLEAGNIVLVERPTDGEIDPRAQAAFDATDEMARLAGAPKAELAEQVEDGDGMSKDELVEEAARKSGRTGK